MAANDNSRYVISERSSTEQHMDQELPMLEWDQSRLQQEILSVLQRKTWSAYIGLPNNTQEQMMITFDRHFRPALRKMSGDSLITFNYGMQDQEVPMPEVDRSRLRQEILSFLQRITRSADDALN
ncbi:uncharacterized protein LOC126734592 [Anthonomus grandis grandis]|uniref:uncharacterized protein LOC126734592 n=1 Tax=Anthonomus grandis grandis TaxID=2921223 RepID=UPI002166508B|nr:uncharacterized protein LOC126734592 [Anthonomus grandis grandis]